MLPARRTALFEEHVALGAELGAYAWAGMVLPWSYRAPLADEQRAVRERAGLSDASQLQIVAVRGPGAIACVERLVPRAIADLAVGASRFTVVLNRFGTICDEALVLRLADDELWLSHGGGTTRAQLAKGVEAGGADVQIAPLDDTHVLAVQGPASADVLAAADVDVAALPPFGHRRAAIAGRPVRVSRTGFTGELGFEIFCAAADAVALWRRLLAVGAPSGLAPYAYRAVDLLRIEAGFPLYPTDLAGLSIWDAGLGWLVRDKAADYVGRAAVEQSRAAAIRRIAGVRVTGAVPVPRGARLRRAEAEVGAVTSSAYSPATDETLCLARVDRAALALALASDEPITVEPAAVGRLTPLPFRARRGLA